MMYVWVGVWIGVEEAIAITMNLAVIDDITQLPAEATVSQLDLPASICQPRLWMIVCCALMLPPTAPVLCCDKIIIMVWLLTCRWRCTAHRR